MRFLALAALAALAMPALPPAAAQTSGPPVVSAPESQRGVALTVYNGGFGLVREVRPLTLARGVTDVRFEGVPRRIDPTSIAVRSLTAPGSFVVREQNYQQALIGTQSVLDAAVGQRVRLVRPMGERVVVEEGVLLSQPGQGRIIRLDDGRVLVDPPGTIELMGLPDGLLPRPSLLWRLQSERAGAQDVETSYITDGLSWKADYVALVNEAETGLDLTGWVTLENQSGATFREARLQLMAGDVRRVQPPLRAPRQAMYDFAVAEARAAPAFEQESFFEYHLYTLDGTTTVAEGETKQMQLLAAAGAAVTRRLVFDGSGQYFPFPRPRRPGAVGEEMSAAVTLELMNTTANRMGMPLPAGRVRVYKADRTGALQFIGEDQIGHTPRDEKVRLYIGDAFDVVGTRRQVAERRLSERVREVTVEVEVRNRKDAPQEVFVVERLWGDWQVTQSTHTHNRLDAYTAEFPVRLGPNETVTVRYTARTTF
ncbi:MAG: DUF4139 domain-containing protein [Rubricoccaceae bacterium]